MKLVSRKKVRCFGLGAAVACMVVFAVRFATAQDAYPQDVVTLITHSSPGGGSDVFLRQLARFLSPELDVDIVVENVRGGSGARAIAELVNSPTDGSTFYAFTPTIIYTSQLSEPASTNVCRKPRRSPTRRAVHYRL